MKYLGLLLVLISNASIAQVPQDFVVEIEPITVTNAPGIHSYSWGMTSDHKWVIIGGRIDGLHQRQPFAAFQESDNNQNVFVIDPVTDQTWLAGLNTLSTPLFEQLQSTNQQFIQRDSTLYIVGGYGRSATANDHLTYPNLTAVSIDGLANAVINGTSINSFFRQITDVNLKVTGGQLGYLDSTFYLVGGHLFDGAYNPMGPDHGPGFTQEYTNEIRTFELLDDGTNLTIANYQAVQDTVNLHRRDYNMAPQIFPNGELGYTAFSGVFDPNDMPYLNSVDITSPTSYVTNNSFNQYLSQYHSAKLPIYDTAANVMHTLFFGGLSQFTLAAAGNLVEDTDVPFVKTISRVTRDASGAMQEIDLDYVEMPSLVGSGAEFIPLHQYYYPNEVLDLNSVPAAKTLVGYIYGGIESTQANIFFTNNGTQSFASNVIFKVFINKGEAGLNSELALTNENIINLHVSPNPVVDDLNLEFFGVSLQQMKVSLFDAQGRLLQKVTHKVSGIGTQELQLSTADLKAGVYVVKVGNGVVSDQQKFVKK